MKIRIKNKKRFGIVLSIVLVLIAMISGTYSLFYHENTAQSKEAYSTGILNIIAKSKSDNINLTNALPMTDEEGVLTDPYVFTIENTGNLDYNFNIRLLSTSDNPIDPRYIKLKIDDGEVTTLSSLTNSIIKGDITLKAKEVMDVSIRIWLASNTPNTEIGKSFNSKIVTEGQAVYTQMNNEDGTLSNSEHENMSPSGNNQSYLITSPPYDYNLAEWVTSLYKTGKKTIVTNNDIEYNYATLFNLMNDRLGGTTKSLDDGNIRYYGASPRNYIDIGDRTTDNQVILWRILGVFDGKVRVIRDKSIGSYSWDTSAPSVNSGSGINEWSQADIMKLLNPGYTNNKDLDSNGNEITVNNSLYWNSGSGKCYNGESYANTNCDFTNSGLSESVKDKIVDQTLYLGGFNTIDIYANQAYMLERGSNVIKNASDGVTRTLSWTGKVGLIYPSDFGYAVDLSTCENKLSDTSETICKRWISGNDSRNHYVTPSSISRSRVTGVNDYLGRLEILATGVSWLVRPVLTLSPNVEIKTDGEGTSTKPYVLK